MALTRKNEKPGKGMQYELDLVGAIGRTKLPKPKPVSEEFSLRDFAQRFYAPRKGRR